eukprot:gene5309-5692_t
MSQKNNNNNRSSSPHRNRSNSPNKNPDPLQLFSGTNGSRKANSPQRKSSLVLFGNTPNTTNTRARSPSPPYRVGSPTSGENFDKVKKNSKGGVLVTSEEISTAFQLLDTERTGQLTIATLKKRLGPLFPEMSAKEFRFLMNNKKEITIDDLKDLLIDNELTNFDPVADAFRVFDPESKGVINEDKLRQAFISLGLGELSDEELDILKRSADVNSDGLISVEDFRDMLEGVPPKNKMEKTGTGLERKLF